MEKKSKVLVWKIYCEGYALLTPLALMATYQWLWHIWWLSLLQFPVFIIITGITNRLIHGKTEGFAKYHYWWGVQWPPYFWIGRMYYDGWHHSVQLGPIFFGRCA